MSTDHATTPRVQRRRVQKLLIIALGVVLVAGSVTGLALGVERWTHPVVFDNQGSFYEAARPDGVYPLVTGFGAGDAAGDRETLTFDSAAVRYAPNGTHAKGRVVVCTPRPGGHHVGDANLDPADDTAELLKRYCARERPVTHGTTMAFGESAHSDYLLLITQPSHAGRSVVKSVDLDYRRSGHHLWQHGTQRVAVDVSVEVEHSGK